VLVVTVGVLEKETTAGVKPLGVNTSLEGAVDTSFDAIFEPYSIAVADAEQFKHAMSSAPGSFTSAGARNGVPTTGTSGARRKVLDYAKTMIGLPYVWGGTSPTSGVDCSGLVMLGLRKAGINIGRVTYQQQNGGSRVPFSQLQAGDLVFWDHGGPAGADHVAFYLGNGQILEAPRTGLNVRIRGLSKREMSGGAWGVHLNY
jgi:cell wall-associated NlpC family hydrolase